MARKKDADKSPVKRKKAKKKDSLAVIALPIIAEEPYAPSGEDMAYAKIMAGNFENPDDEELFLRLCNDSEKITIDDEMAATRFAKLRALRDGNMVALLMADKALAGYYVAKSREKGPGDAELQDMVMMLNELETKSQIISVDDLDEEDRLDEPGAQSIRKADT